MGFNSSVFISNDSLHEIESDPKFGEKLAQAIQRHYASNTPVYIDTEFRSQVACVMSCSHADNTTVIAVGGNHSTVLGEIYNNGNHSKPEDQIKLLKALAEKMGYRLVKKTKE